MQTLCQHICVMLSFLMQFTPSAPQCREIYFWRPRGMVSLTDRLARLWTSRREKLGHWGSTRTSDLGSNRFEPIARNILLLLRCSGYNNTCFVINGICAHFQIDTLAAEYPAATNYLYCTYHGQVNQSVQHLCTVGLWWLKCRAIFV